MSEAAAPEAVSEHEALQEAVLAIQSRMPGAEAASVLVIAGSGLGGFVKSVSPIRELSYSEIPGIGGSTVAGHAGKLMLAEVGEGKIPLLIMSGRRHLYEGLSAAEAARLPRAILLAFPQIKRVVISNAAGGLNPTFAIGDLMLISDHINWMFKNPLVGPNREDWGPRFPDASDIYSRELRQMALDTALRQQLSLRQGVYVAMHGPSYETRVEVNMLRHTLGADAVGMSTVPEALIATHLGKQVLGISFISNLLINPAVTTHEEVVANSALVEERFSRLLTALLPELHTVK